MNTLGTFAHHPALAKAFFTFNGHILSATTLTIRQRELIVLRVAHRRRCAYEFAQHVVVANDADISDDEIAALVNGPDDATLVPLEAAVLRAVDELIDDSAISDTTWATLGTWFDTQQIMDLIFTVGTYSTLALMMRSFQLDLDDDLKIWMANKHR